MIAVVEVFFWLLIFLPMHTYLLYPVIIKVISCRRKSVKAGVDQPKISILISAYNEEKVIRERILNIASLQYDFSKLEVIAGSDNSTDKTNEILTSLQKEYSWLKIYLFNNRRGKASVLNDLVRLSRNDILVFTDANTVFKEDAVALLTSHFNDSSVGGVSGRLILQEPENGFNKSVEEKRYWEYETSIKDSEGKCGILIGANGGIFAIRKELFKDISADKAVTDDLYITLSVLQKKFNFNYDYKAVAFEEVAKEIGQEYNRKKRFAATNFQTMLFFKDLLFDRNVLLAYAFWSHKVIRWFLPQIYIVILFLNIFLIYLHLIYIVAFLVQIQFFILCFLGFILSKMKIRITLLSLPFFFFMSNVALIIGFYKFIRGRHTVIWNSTPR
jgi:poly-beta-1,6-N-acetyl-D-glucosamine synthase